VTPLGIESLPSDIARLLRALPQLGDRLEEVAESTSQMAAMREGIERLDQNTQTLPGVARDVERIATLLERLAAIDTSVKAVAKDTGVLPGVESSIESMNGRMAEIEAAMPVLVEVQQHLAKLPEAIETLGTGLDRLAGLMEQLLNSMNTLDRNVESLHASMEPIGRIADRLPGSGSSRR